MTSRETAIADRLHDAASRIPVDASVVPDSETVRMRATPRSSSWSSPRRRVVIAGVAAAVASAAAGIVVVSTRPASETLNAGPASSSEAPVTPPPPTCPPSPESPTSCSPLVAAHLASPPAWFGEPQGGFHTFGFRGGRWVSMAIGRESGDAITDPIVVSVFDGTYGRLDQAEAVTIGGMSLRSATFEDWDWQVLATTDTPTVVVSGEVDQDTLGAVLAAVEVEDPAGEFSLRVGTLPMGYSEIAPPRPLGPDYQYRRTLGSASGDVGISEISDSTDPLLAAAMSGADLTAVDVGGGAGWIGTANNAVVGPLRMLVWSPGPGVVFEISSQDPERTDDELIELAQRTSTLDPARWDAAYRD